MSPSIVLVAISPWNPTSSQSCHKNMVITAKTMISYVIILDFGRGRQFQRADNQWGPSQLFQDTYNDSQNTTSAAYNEYLDTLLIDAHNDSISSFGPQMEYSSMYQSSSGGSMIFCDKSNMAHLSSVQQRSSYTAPETLFEEKEVMARCEVTLQKERQQRR